MSSALIRKLREATDDREKVMLICVAEGAELRGKHREELAEILRPFVLRYLTQDDLNYHNHVSGSRDLIIATASAIRKYIAMLDVRRMEEIAEWIRPGVHPMFELEIAKMVYRKFCANPPATLDAYPKLAFALNTLIRAYMTPTLMRRDGASTMALIAVAALTVSRSSLHADILAKVCTQEERWMKMSVHSDLRRALSDWRPENIEAAAWLAAVITSSGIEG